MCVGLLPILWSTGTGSEVMKRIAAPMVGGIFTSFLLELLVYPAIYAVWRQRSIRGTAEPALIAAQEEPSDMREGSFVSLQL